MRVNAIGLLKQAADTSDHRRKDRGSYAYMLGELADHLADVRAGKHTWEEFAQFYCLTPADAEKSA